MFVLPKEMYRFNTVLIKIPMDLFLTEIKKTILKFTYRTKEDSK